MSPTEKTPITMQEALESMVPIINDAIHSWLSQQDPEAIRKKVFDTLDKAKNEIAPKLMGFTKDSWGRWEIDHCNGRAGESSIGDYMKQHQGAAIQAFIDQLDLNALRPFSKKEIEEIRGDYRRRVIQDVRGGIRHKAEADANALLNKYSTDDLVALIHKTQALIDTGYEIPVQQKETTQ